MGHFLTGEIDIALGIKVLAKRSDNNLCLWVPGKPGSAKKLEENIEAKTHVSCGRQQGDRNDEEPGHQYDNHNCPNWRIGREQSR